jgi:nicotinamide mononucleotide transporter
MNGDALTGYLATNWIEILGVITCVVSTWLTARRRISCWPIGLISDVAYIVVFYQSRLYASALLTIGCLPLAFYGWWYWSRGFREEGEVRIVRQPRSSLWIGLLLGVLGSIVLGVWMQRIHAALPYLDAALTSFSVVGTWWEMRKYISNWWLWIAVNVIYVGEFVSQHLLMTALLYIGLILLSVFGIREWRRAARTSEAAANGPGQIAVCTTF